MPRVTPETIYAAYPRKVGRVAALKAIGVALKRISRDHADPMAWMLERTEAYTASPAGQKSMTPGYDVRPHPSTWFNQGRYDDDPEEWQRPNEPWRRVDDQPQSDVKWGTTGDDR